jgi:hypothetical protein
LPEKHLDTYEIFPYFTCKAQEKDKSIFKEDFRYVLTMVILNKTLLLENQVG